MRLTLIWDLSRAALVLHLPAMFGGTGFIMMVVVKPGRVVRSSSISFGSDSRDTRDADHK